MQDWEVNTPVQEILDPMLGQAGVRILVKRDDLTDPVIMGNKWRKLKYNIQSALARNVETIITYGGAHSNHIAATAAAANQAGLRSIGIIRGEELTPSSNPTLSMAAAHGMTFHFVSRSDYKHLKDKLALPHTITSRHLILPEGGTNELAVKGCAELVNEIDVDYDILTTPVGTGGTMAGVLRGLGGSREVWGFSALRGKWIEDDFLSTLRKHDIPHRNYKIFQDETFGGYARFKLSLIQFILDFKQKNGILIEPIYTGKMFFSVWELVKNAQIARGCTLLMLHTGGLQAIEGFNHRFGVALPTR